MRLISASVLACVIVSSAASISFGAYSFPAFSISNVNRTYQNSNLLSLGGTTAPDAVYTKGTVTLNWSSVGQTTPSTSSSNAWSSEPRITVSSTAGTGTATSSTALPTYGSGNVVYAGTSLLTPTGGASNADPASLTFTFNLANNYTVAGGVMPPIFINMRQAFTPFTTQNITWGNVVVSLDVAAPVVPPASTAFGAIPGTQSRARTAGQVHWYSFNVATANTYVLDTLGSVLTASSLGDLNDTELGLYSSTGALIANNDDDGVLVTSRISQALTPGTYYVAVGAFDTTFAAGFAAASTSTQTGTLRLNIAALPEPASIASLGLAMAMIRRRR